MKIKYFCSWWGLDHLGLEPMLKKIKDSGFDGVEIGIPFENDKQELLKILLNKYQLEIIAHQYQATGNFNNYKVAFEKSLINSAKFKPLFVNSHTGKDFWTIKQNLGLLKISEHIESNFNIPIFHETHRKHLLFSTYTANEFFKLDPNLKITADFSHWTCVSESLLEDQEELLQEAIRRTHHIHARIGFEEGPQIPDPRAKEWEKHLKIFTQWWQKIAYNFKDQQKEFLTITPEFGPIPYTWINPYNHEPMSDFFEINVWMKKYLKQSIKV